MAETKIEWTGKTWNPVVGCTKVSAGCKNCYAKTMHGRLTKMGSPKYSEPFEKVRPHPPHLVEPLGWKKPTTIFVNSMSDLFHEDVPDEYIAAVFGVMAACPQHTFQVLTKRAERMREWFKWIRNHSQCATRAAACAHYAQRFSDAEALRRTDALPFWTWPLPNVWLGVSVEDQKRADERIPHLLETPAAVRFVSAEPLLGPLDLVGHLDGDATGHESGGPQGWVPGPCLDWIIVGGESGRGARPFEVEWARVIVKQCKAAVVPVFVKQLGAKPVEDLEPTGNFRTGPEGTRQFELKATAIRLRSRKGTDMAEWPADLRVREMPTPGTP